MKNSQEIWNSVVTSYKTYLEATSHFLTADIDRISILRKALSGPDRKTVFHLIKYLKLEELQQLFADLVYWASFSHSAVGAVREVIKAMPKEWVINHIEQVAEPLLVNGTYDEYRRMLELYIEIDSELTKRLAQRATQSTDLDIQEAGKDYLMKISS